MTLPGHCVGLELMVAVFRHTMTWDHMQQSPSANVMRMIFQYASGVTIITTFATVGGIRPVNIAAGGGRLRMAYG